MLSVYLQQDILVVSDMEERVIRLPDADRHGNLIKDVVEDTTAVVDVHIIPVVGNMLNGHAVSSWIIEISQCLGFKE